MRNDEFNVTKITNEQDGFASFEFGGTQNAEFSFTSTNNFGSAPKDELNDNPTLNNENASSEQRRRQDENPEKNVDELLEGEISGSEGTSNVAGSSSSGSSGAATSTSASTASSAASSAASVVGATTAAIIVAVPTIVAVTAAILLSTSVTSYRYTPTVDSIEYSITLAVDEKDDRTFRVFLQKDIFDVSSGYDSYLLSNGENAGGFFSLESNKDYKLYVIGYLPSVIQQDVKPVDTNAAIDTTGYEFFADLPNDPQIFKEDTVKTLQQDVPVDPYDNLVTFTYEGLYDRSTFESSITINEILDENVNGCMVMFDRGTMAEGTYNLGDEPGTYSFSLVELNPDLDFDSPHEVCIAYYYGSDYSVEHHSQTQIVYLSAQKRSEFYGFAMNEAIDESNGDFWQGTGCTLYQISYVDDFNIFSDFVIHLRNSSNAETQRHYYYQVKTYTLDSNGWGALNLISDDQSETEITTDILVNETWTVTLEYKENLEDRIYTIDRPLSFYSTDVTSFDIQFAGYYYEQDNSYIVPLTMTYAGFDTVTSGINELRQIRLGLLGSGEQSITGTLQGGGLPPSGEEVNYVFTPTSSEEEQEIVSRLQEGTFTTLIIYGGRNVPLNRWHGELHPNPSLLGASVSPVPKSYSDNLVMVTLNYLDRTGIYSDFQIVFTDKTFYEKTGMSGELDPVSLATTTDAQEALVDLDQLEYEPESVPGYYGPSLGDTFNYKVTAYNGNKAQREYVGSSEGQDVEFIDGSISFMPVRPEDEAPEYQISCTENIEQCNFAVTLTNVADEDETYTWSNLAYTEGSSATLDIAAARQATSKPWNFVGSKYHYTFEVNFNFTDYILDDSEYQFNSTIEINGMQVGDLYRENSPSSAGYNYYLPTYIDFREPAYDDVTGLMFEFDKASGESDTEDLEYDIYYKWTGTDLNTVKSLSSGDYRKRPQWYQLDISELMQNVTDVSTAGENALEEGDYVKVTAYVLTDTTHLLIGTQTFQYDTGTNHDQVYGIYFTDEGIMNTTYTTNVYLVWNNTHGSYSPQTWIQFTSYDETWYVPFLPNSDGTGTLDFNFTTVTDPNTEPKANYLSGDDLERFINILLYNEITVSVWSLNSAAQETTYINVQASYPVYALFTLAA